MGAFAMAAGTMLSPGSTQVLLRFLCTILGAARLTYSWSQREDVPQDKPYTEKFDKIEKLFSCAICDALVEDVARELSADVENMSAEQKYELASKPENKWERMEMGPKATLDR